MSPNDRGPAPSRAGVGPGLARLAIAAGLALSMVPCAWAGTYYVDASSPNCSPNGSGSEAQPYCTISEAVAKRSAAGNTILVKPGVYREQVDIRASGVSGSPIVVRALGPGVIVDGGDDFSDRSEWEPASGTVWQADDVTWQPQQVFVDGARLADSTAAPGPLPANAFAWVSGEGLYVNLGGTNPGARETVVGHRQFGFNMSSRSWITIEGFEVRHAESRGIYLQYGCANLSLLRNTVTYSDESGIEIIGGTGHLLEGNVVGDSGPHGISLISGATNCIVRDNESYRSADPDIRKADGIYLYAAPANTLYRNRTHHNQDTGIHFGPGADNCVSFNNRSWSNGDHGFDHLSATGTTHIHDVCYGNHKDGFSIEGGATGTRLYNCIAVNNGLTTDEFDLWLEQASAPGFVSDYNIFWNSGVVQEPIRLGATKYWKLSDYQAVSSQDAHSIQADPRFANPEAGDFRLMPGSPAIDSGNSGVPFWPATDAAGSGRVDVPGVPNGGAGSPPFADRGALERVTAAPTARLTVTPASGTALLAITADASASSDPDSGIVSYRFDFGDGTIVGPQASPVATHGLLAGNRNVTVAVTDGDGLVATQVVPVSVGSSLRASLALNHISGNAPLDVLVDAGGSSDSYGTIVSYTFAFGDGSTAGPQTSPAAPHTYGAGTWRAIVTVRNHLGESATAAVNLMVADRDPGPDLVGNPSWEGDSLGWVPENASIRRVTGGFDGSRALRVQGHANRSSFGIRDNPHWIASTQAADTRYRFRAWVRSASAGGSVRLRIRERNAHGISIGPLVYSYPVQLAPGWQRVTIEYLSAGVGSSIEFGIIDTPAAAGEVFEVDNVSIHVIIGGADPVAPAPGATFIEPLLFPNPVADRATLRFSLSQAGPLRIEIFDATGRLIRTLVDEAEVLPGQFEYPLICRNEHGPGPGRGVYFYRIQARERTVTGRFLSIR
jgi:PKD domain-containing protein/copper-binding protein NosD